MLKNALHKQLLSVVQRLAVISRVMKHGSSVYFLLCQFYGPLGVRMFLSHRSVFNVPSGCLRWPETNDGVQGQIPELRGSARPRPSERAVWILSTHRPEVLQVHGSSPAACHSNDSLDSSCWPLQPWPFIRAARERERERDKMSECDRERMEQLMAVSLAHTTAFCCSYTLRPLCYQCEDAHPPGAAHGTCEVHTHSIIWTACVSLSIQQDAGTIYTHTHTHTHTHLLVGSKKQTRFDLSGASHAEGHRLAEGKCNLNKYTYMWPILVWKLHIGAGCLLWFAFFVFPHIQSRISGLIKGVLKTVNWTGILSFRAQP